MPLSDIRVRNAKAAEKDYKLSDAFGLYLLVSRTGAKLWRYNYTFDKKQKTAAIGSYPLVTLTAAREERDRLKKLLAEGKDPNEEKRLRKLAEATVRGITFKSVGEEFLERQSKRMPPLAPRTLGKKRWIIEDIAGPTLDRRPISEIKPVEILSILQKLENKGHLETARRTRSVLGELFRFAVTTQRAETDPTPVLRNAVAAPQVTHMAAIIDEREFGILMNAIDEHTGWPTLRMAMRFTALTFCRPGEARLAEWDEIDFENKIWSVPASRMKMRRPHKVPLSHQAISLLWEAREFDPRSKWLFPSIRTNKRPLSDNAINQALRRMGYSGAEMVSHGFRSSASTILNARKFDADVIELQLAHLNSDRIRRIYNRGDMWEDRVQLMQKWANIIDELQLA